MRSRAVNENSTHMQQQELDEEDYMYEGALSAENNWDSFLSRKHIKCYTGSSRKNATLLNWNIFSADVAKNLGF